MCVKRIGDVEIVGYEAAECILPDICAWGLNSTDVCASIKMVCQFIDFTADFDGESEARHRLRGEVAAFPSQYRDIDILSGSNFSHQAREAIIEITGQGIELLLNVQGYDSNFAPSAQRD